MSKDEFMVKFRGVRGGYPMPGPTTVKYGGNTTCIEIRVDGHLIIIDAGTGIIRLGQQMMAEYAATKKPMHATILLTHLHHDHTQGFPFFVPVRHAQSQICILGPRPQQEQDLESALNQVLQPPVFPVGLEEMHSRRRVGHIRQGETLAFTDPQNYPQFFSVHDDLSCIDPNTASVKVLRGFHHPREGVLIYRIDYRGHSVVVATDTEGYIGVDRRLVDFAHGADLLIHDAEYDEHEYADTPPVRQGWGHSTWRMAVDVALAAQVQRLALTHHSPAHDDAYLEEMERKAQAHFPNAFMAIEDEPITLL